jgi:hypothetical protein
VQKLDWIVLAICFGLAWPMPGLGEPGLAWIEQQFARFARNKWAALAAIGSATIVIRLALLWWMGVPQPQVHDEFSYLLAADTFAHGRLANPPHPLWIFFDTFHVLQQPTYASMYPPAQGMVLAIGQLLGHPWIGVLLSTAAMCVAITWMLQGWMPSEWALLGGALVLLRFGIFSYWMNSYWGGAVAAIGAAMVLGALARILDRWQPRDAVVFGLGAGILATSRPLEGFIFCVPVVAALLWRTWRQQAPARQANVRRVLLPLVAGLVCFVGFVAYYNWRVTGNAIVFPHFIEQKNYITAPVFLWEHDKPRLTYANPQFDDFYNHWVPGLYQTGWEEAKGQLWWKATEFWQFFLGPALLVPFLALPWLLGERRNRLLLAQVVISAIGLWVVVYYHAHYAAPLMATIFLLLLRCMRRMRGWKIGGHAIGAGLTRLAVLYSLLIGPVYFVQMVTSEPNFLFDWVHTHSLLVMMMPVLALVLLRLGFSRIAPLLSGRSWLLGTCELLFLSAILLQVCIGQRNRHPDDFQIEDQVNDPFRKTVEQQLDAMPGEHLVLVRYSPDHNSANEFVYNQANIDHAKTVWAREIPGMDLTPLLRYFRNRDVWVFEPDADDSTVHRFAPQSTAPPNPAP